VGNGRDRSAVSVLPLPGLQGSEVLFAKSTADSQLSDHTQRMHGFVRTVWPVTQVDVENFFATLAVYEACLDADLRHVFPESMLNRSRMMPVRDSLCSARDQRTRKSARSAPIADDQFLLIRCNTGDAFPGKDEQRSLPKR